MNKICELFKIKYPIIQAGMVWTSGWRLAAAVSNSGGLGLIGAGSMYPDILREHIQRCKKATDKSFGDKVPLFYPQLEDGTQPSVFNYTIISYPIKFGEFNCLLVD